MLIAALGLGGCGALTFTPDQVERRNTARYEGLSMKKMYSCISVDDEDATAPVEISTRDCYVAQHGVFRDEWNDYFLRAYKNRTTDRVTYEVHAILYHDSWQMPNVGAYIDPSYGDGNNVVEVEGSRVSNSMTCGDHGCLHQEHFKFEIGVRLLRYLSDNYNEKDNFKQVSIRVYTRRDSFLDFSFNQVELIGIYRMAQSI